MKNSVKTALFCVYGMIVASLASCSFSKPVRIYTSLAPEVIAEMGPLLAKAVKGVEVTWYQASNEEIAKKVKADHSDDDPQADLILGTDALWYQDLKVSGKLLPYASKAAAEVPERYRDPEHHFSTARIHVMLLAYNSDVLKPEELPSRWSDLKDAKWSQKFSMPSPFEVQAGFIHIGILSKIYGWEFFAQLKQLGLFAAGGNPAVIHRMETRERPLGAVLLETVLRAQAKGSPVRPIYPLDGVIPVPGPIAILASTKHPEATKKVYDWFFSPAAQNVIVRGGAYSPLPKIVSPDNARPWAALQAQLMVWSPALLSELHSNQDQIRAKFSEVVLH